MDYFQLIMRVAGFVLTSIAFSCMGAALPVSIEKYRSFNFLLAANVLACLYSVAQVAALAKRSSPESISVSISAVLDPIFAYLLLASASAATTSVDQCPEDHITCMRVVVSLVAGFLAFASFAVLSLR